MSSGKSISRMMMSPVSQCFPTKRLDVCAALLVLVAHAACPPQARPVYLTLDIDCLDPAHAPGTGTPEPAGLSTAQVMTLLEGWGDLNFVGMDCVEVSPPYDHAELTSQAAAHFVWTYLSARVAQGLSPTA